MQQHATAIHLDPKFWITSCFWIILVKNLQNSRWTSIKSLRLAQSLISSWESKALKSWSQTTSLSKHWNHNHSRYLSPSHALFDTFDQPNNIGQLVTASTDIQIPNMAEKNVSDPPTVIPKTRAPASEALLDEKVQVKPQWIDWSDRSSCKKWHARLLQPSIAIPLLSSTC